MLTVLSGVLVVFLPENLNCQIMNDGSKEILYHYCSTEAFHSIVTTHSIRLSDLSLSNDLMEGNMPTDALVRLAKRDRLDGGAIQILRGKLDLYIKECHSLGFCLSKHRDKLSQWRGYAADATGVAIGFSREYLELLRDEYTRMEEGDFLGFTIEEVKYDQKEHEAQVQSLYEELKKAIEKGISLEVKMDMFTNTRSNNPELQEIGSIKAALDRSIFFIIFDLAFVFKSPAFSEEAEWRLLARNMGKKIKYNVKSDCLIPYMSYELKQFGSIPVIANVILGPKHRTSDIAILRFLNSYGYAGVGVSCSAASYR